MAIKIIPEAAIQKESAISNDTNNNLAQDEEASIASGKYSNKLQESSDLTQLLHFSLYRYGIAFAFLVVCSALTFVLYLFSKMLLAYANYIIDCPDRLEDFLSEVWKILTGASVIVFVQLLGWTVKRKADESRKDS